MRTFRLDAFLGAALGAFLAVLVSLLVVEHAHAADVASVPQDRVVAALVSAPYDWKPNAAREIASEVLATVQDDLYPFGGLYYPRAYGGPRVAVGSSWPLPQTTAHEYQHAWEFERVGYSDSKMRDALERLARRDDYPEAALRAQWVLAYRANDLWHGFHWVLGDEPINPADPSSVGLHWRYDLIPPEHRDVWMAYGRIWRRTLVPEVAR